MPKLINEINGFVFENKIVGKTFASEAKCFHYFLFKKKFGHLLGYRMLDFICPG